MKLSIIIPVYNRADYIGSCLENLIKIQTDEMEILIVDDGSADESLSLCRDYEKNDKRIKVYHKKNGGVSSARNLGIKHASGEYLMFVDSDDIVCSDVLSEFLKKKWEKDIYFFDYYIDDGQLRYCKRDLTMEQKNGHFLLHTFLSLKNNMIWNNLYKASVLKSNEVQFREDIKMGEDLLFNLEFAECAKNWDYIQQPIYTYNMATVGSALKVTRLSYIHDYTQMYNIMEEYYMDPEFAEYKNVTYFMNGVFMNLAGAEYDPKHLYIIEFERSQLYKDISDQYLESGKLKLKKWFITKHIYRNHIIKSIVKRLFI